MGERGWLVRQQFVRVISESPAPPATWLAVARRSAVVLAFFVAGIATDSMPTTVLACFGALQVGLLEAALPLGRTVSLMVWMTVSAFLAAFVAMAVGGTWAFVVVVALLAYAFGATASLSPSLATVGISTMALAVIFGGMPQDLATSATHAAWVALGAAAQAIVAIVLWRPERWHFVRRALAIKLQTDVRLMATSSIEPDALVATHAASDQLAEVLDRAELAPSDDRQVRLAFSSAIVATRAVVAWMIVRGPGAQSRMSASLPLLGSVRTLLWGSRRGCARRLARRGTQQAPAPDSAVDVGDLALSAIATACSDMDRLVARVPLPEQPLQSLAVRGPARSRMGAVDVVHALLPKGRLSRHGIRMAIGLLLAESLTFLLPIEHSFWLPLTVVFTLKPDWSYTVIRGTNRTIGNLLAVIALPALFLVAGPSGAYLALPLAVLLAVAYRWFFGNYVIASFGLAGSILLLDYTLDPNPDLFAMRIAATFLGAVLSMAVALALPTWRSREAPALVDDLVHALARLRGVLDEAAAAAAGTATRAAADAEIDAHIIRARAAMQALEPVATGALLEPRRTQAPVRMFILLEAGARYTAYLLSVGYLRLAGSERSLDEHDTIRLGYAESDWNAAVERYRALLPAC